MNDKESTDNPVAMEETNVSSSEILKKELSTWIEIKEILDKKDLNESPKYSVKTSEKPETVINIDAKPEIKKPERNGESEISDKLPELERSENPQNLSKIDEKIQSNKSEIIEETIQLIEETIIIPDDKSPEIKQIDETIEFKVIEIEAKPSASLCQKSPSIEAKQRSLIEDIFEDWTDENTEEEEEEEESYSLKLDDSVEHQLKTLLDEKTSKPLDSQKTDAKIPENETKLIMKEPSKFDQHPDRKELLAILEDDAEPDWSDLKPTISAKEEPQKSLEQTQQKLDPLVERQLALKQLLELPVASKKPRISPRKSPVIPKKMVEEDEAIEEVKFDETRSGRKRKPTEKAREHEITAKRTKIIKPKVLVGKSLKKPEDPSEDMEVSSDDKKPARKIRKIPQKPPNSVKTPKKSPKTPQDSPKPRKKSVNEIDRLLQDEGVVNLLYDVEQPPKKRLVPLSKSQTKVMDIQKVQRELKIRTKLVKNAVLRLRTSASPGPNAPRAKRSSAGTVPVDDAGTKDSNSEFLYPAKIRNAADSVIVRRHSSSSFSSASGSPRVSIDSSERQSVEDKFNKRSYLHEEKKKADAKRLRQNKLMAKSRGKLIKDGVPESSGEVKNGRRMKRMKNKVTFAKGNEEEGGDSSQEEEPNEEEDELSACLAEAVTALANESTNRKGSSRKAKRANVQFVNKEINVQRHGKLVQLILTPSVASNIRNGITLEMMKEFREVLGVLRKDDDCRIVLLTSTGSSFCEGLELSSLLQDDDEARRENAERLAEGVKEFVKSLAGFNKPIVAGVQGSAVGLGVTMLPLFDLVIASDKASFSTPYGKLGQIGEGVAVFTLSHVLGSAVTSELLLGGRTLTANEALRAGLVTRVLWPDRFHVELLPSLRAMSEQSSQSMEATKALLRHSLRAKLDAALESECYLLVQHWCSPECQNAIRAYMDEKVQ